MTALESATLLELFDELGRRNAAMIIACAPLANADPHREVVLYGKGPLIYQIGLASVVTDWVRHSSGHTLDHAEDDDDFSSSEV